MLKLMIWLLFGVASAILPLFLSGIVLFNHNKYLDLTDTWSHGELLLVSMTLLMASLGELIVYHTFYLKVKAFITGIGFILVIICAVWYMDTFSELLSGVPTKQDFLRKWSPYFFGFCLTIATVCIMLPKEPEDGN